MKNLVSLVVLVMTLAALSLKAGWIKAYDNEGRTEEGHVVQQTADGGYIVIGTTFSDPEEDGNVWLLKTDANGEKAWEKTYGPALWWNTSGQQTSDGGYIIADGTESFGTEGYDVWLLKTDEQGDTVWTKTYGGPQHDVALAVHQTDDGGYIIAGFRDAIKHPDYGYLTNGDMWLIKTDADGDTVWTKTYGVEDKHDYADFVSQTSDGGYIIVCARLYSPATLNKVSIMKTDDKGDSIWTYRTSEYIVFECVQQTTDEGYVATGINFGDLTVLKLDANGNRVWEKTYGNPEPGYNDGGLCIQETSEGGYIITGRYEFVISANIISTLWLLKTEADGDTVWSRLYGDDGEFDEGFWVEQTSDGGYIVTGRTTTWAVAGSDLLLMKTNSEGLIDAVEEEPIVDSRVNWQIIYPVGQKIVLRYSDRPDGFCAEIFDAAGRKVDEVRSTSQSGTITWGECYGPGVYFIRPEWDNAAPQKVVLIR